MAERLGRAARQTASTSALAETRRTHRAYQGEATVSVLGIDIGVSGAVALVDQLCELQDVWEMPCLRDGPKNRRTINAPLLAELIYKTHAARAFVEAVGPRPQEGAVGAFAFGDCKGVVRGVLAAAGIPLVYIQPAQWKRVVHIPPGKAGAKDAARSQALGRWPNMAEHFKLIKDDGKAEAALIAVAGLLRFSDNVVQINGNAGAEKGAA